MFRRILLLGALALMLAPVGCMSRRPVLWSWPHWKRKINVVLEDFHQAHMDFDRIVLDADERPLEDL